MLFRSLLGLVQNAVNLLNVPPNYDYVVSGIVIAAAATLDVSRRRLIEQGLRRRTMLIRREKAETRDAAQASAKKDD